MPQKRRRTVTLDSPLDAAIRLRAKQHNRSYSSTVNEALEDYLALDATSLAKVRKLAGVLDVKAPQVINSLLRDRLEEIEARKKRLDPAAMFLVGLANLGSSEERR